jgi:hypothetical protein
MAACVTLAPGADKVHITKVSSEVSNCTAVGNIKVPRGADGNVTAFETAAPLGVPVEGIAYRCP